MKNKNSKPYTTIVPEVAVVSNYETNSQWGHDNDDRKQLHWLMIAPARSVHMNILV